MSSRQLEPRAWLLRRWLLVIAVIFILQFGFITWLGQPAIDLQPRTPRRVPVIALLAGGRAEKISGVENPTLLVLANRNGFSGNAWLQTESVRDPSRPWTEPPRPLPPSVDQFGGPLDEFVRTRLSQRMDVARKPPPSIGEYFPMETLALSTFSVEGEVAQRRLLSEFKLESKPSEKVLTNSVVQIAVDPGGNVFSAVLLVKCGSAEADADALSLARSAHFSPIIRDGPGRSPALRPNLDWGRFIFRWNTLPMLATNTVSPVR